VRSEQSPTLQAEMRNFIAKKKLSFTSNSVFTTKLCRLVPNCLRCRQNSLGLLSESMLPSHGARLADVRHLRRVLHLLPAPALAAINGRAPLIRVVQGSCHGGLGGRRPRLWGLDGVGLDVRSDLGVGGSRLHWLSVWELGACFVGCGFC